MTPEEIVILVAGVQLITSIFFLNTAGFFYTTMYKILPFFLGLGLFWTIRHVFL